MSVIPARHSISNNKITWVVEEGEAESRAKGEVVAGLEAVDAYWDVSSIRPPQVRLSIEAVTSPAIVADAIGTILSTVPRGDITVGGEPLIPVVSVDVANRKWLELKWSHFKRAGRQQRVGAGLRALKRGTVAYGVDAETLRWAAQDVDVEDI